MARMVTPSKLPNPIRIHTLQPGPRFPFKPGIRAPDSPEALCIYSCHLCRASKCLEGDLMQ
eukprot:14164106-Alexandrium_andersonii.AAC.1